MEQVATLEQEIAELSKAIEAKRSALAAERGVVAEREVVRQVINNYASVPASASAIGPAAPAEKNFSAGNDGYLKALDSASLAKVNELVAGIGEYGFKQAINKAKAEIPYILDAFHDALVTYLYDELKTRGIVK